MKQGVIFLSCSLRNFYQVYEVINFLETIYIQYLILSPEANYILKLYLLWAIRL